jgi:hypothetical protein
VLSPTSGCRSLNNQGPHGLTEILYAFTSGAGNNGSAFAGLNANTWWYNVALGWDMLIGRLFMMIPVLALAGNLAQKKSVPPSPGTFPVKRPLFTVLLVGVIVILGALTFFPALEPGTDSGTPAAAGGTAFLNRTELFPPSGERRQEFNAKAKRTVMAEKKSLWNTEIMAQALWIRCRAAW